MAQGECRREQTGALPAETAKEPVKNTLKSYEYGMFSERNIHEGSPLRGWTRSRGAGVLCEDEGSMP